MKYTDRNSKAWDAIVELGCEWTQPISHESYLKSLNGDILIYLTPSRPIPKSWWPKIKGKKILGVACGGGQQMPILAGRGADCVVMDYSRKQLEQDKFVMEREKISYKMVLADATERFPFNDEEFDIVLFGFSNPYIEDLQFVFNECYRVMKKGGILFSGLDNGINFLFADQSKEPLVVEQKLPYNSQKSNGSLAGYNGYDDNSLVRFSHTMEDDIGGQLKAGFMLIDLFEDIDTPETEGFLVKKYIPQYLTTYSKKP